MNRDLQIADLFCGAGGSTTGALLALEQLDLRAQVLAVNHWDVAIGTHSANHTTVRHACMSLEAADPIQLVPGGRLDLLIASPSCTHHSSARGGRPSSDQQRADPWLINRWLSELTVNRLMVENVRELQDWGPVNPKTGKPIKSRSGQYFRAWVASLDALGYDVEWRILRAADYGDATTRKRFFLQAVRRASRPRLRIVWPEPSHARAGSLDIHMGRQPWRSARDIIDWSIPGKSIFRRQRPLAPKTLGRIEAGIRKYCGNHAGAFLLVMRRHADGQSLDVPLPTITAGGSHFGLIQTKVEPFVLGQHGGSVARAVGEPLPTIATGGAISVIEPVIEPFLVKLRGDQTSAPLDQPVPTILTGNNLYLAQPFMVRFDFGGPRPPIDLDQPVPTVTTKNGLALCRPFIAPFYGTGVPDSVDDPLATITTKDRFGLCEPVLEEAPANDNQPIVVDVNGVPHKLDILFRMLEPHELAAATGFPADYKFTGSKADIHKQIGNAVPVNLSKALIRSMLETA